MLNLFLQITLILASLFHFGLSPDAYEIDQSEISEFALEIELSNELDDDQFEKYLVANHDSYFIDCGFTYNQTYSSVYVFSNTRYHSIRAPPVS